MVQVFGRSDLAGPYDGVVGPLDQGLRRGTTQKERVEIFLSYLSVGTTPHSLSVAALITSIAAVILGALLLIKATPGQRAMNITVVILGSLFTLLNIFQLL